MVRVTTVLALSFCALCPGPAHAQARIPTSIQALCEDDDTCKEDFTRYVKEAIDASTTHIYEPDRNRARFHITISVAKVEEGARFLGDAFARSGVDGTPKGQCGSDGYSKFGGASVVAAAVRRELNDYVLK
jgi:hypothetical protein